MTKDKTLDSDGAGPDPVPEGVGLENMLKSFMTSIQSSIDEVRSEVSGLRSQVVSCQDELSSFKANSIKASNNPDTSISSSPDVASNKGILSSIVTKARLIDDPPKSESCLVTDNLKPHKLSNREEVRDLNDEIRD